MAVSQQRKDALDVLYADWVISASLPHSTNRNPEAKKFVDGLCPGYKLPEPRKVINPLFVYQHLFILFSFIRLLTPKKNPYKTI
jgi:hypothetical protein